MSMFSEVGKTISSICKTLRSTAELAEFTVSDKGLQGTVGQTFTLVNGALESAAKQGKLESQFEEEKFLDKLDKRRMKYAAKKAAMGKGATK